MTLKYLGHSSFFIKSKDARVITDPFDPKIGLKFPKIEADLVTLSHHHADHDNVSGVTGDPLVVDFPGEYEKKGIRVTGFKSYHDDKKGEERGENILYRIEADDINILHCGDLGILPDDELLDALGEVDVLLVPVGGFYTIDAATAANLVKKLDPGVVVPMHFNRQDLDQKTFGNLTTVDDFLKKMGLDHVEPQESLTLKKDDLGEEMKVVVLDINS